MMMMIAGIILLLVVLLFLPQLAILFLLLRTQMICRPRQLGNHAGEIDVTQQHSAGFLGLLGLSGGGERV